jgi:hypothetical protein
MDSREIQIHNFGDYDYPDVYVIKGAEWNGFTYWFNCEEYGCNMKMVIKAMCFDDALELAQQHGFWKGCRKFCSYCGPKPNYSCL